MSARYAAALAALRERAEETGYIDLHAERFGELFEAVHTYTKGRGRLLDVGTSPFTALYRELFPDLSLATLDRPTAMGGMSAAKAKRICGSTRHANADLNREPVPNSLGTFDMIVFCEIIEHLVVNPEQLLGELIGRLAPEGVLYLTTPNVFGYHKLMQVRHKANPQAVMFRRGEDGDAAYHFREYALNELVADVDRAGGRTVVAGYSDCWERDPAIRAALAPYPYLHGNIVMVAKRAESRDLPTQIEFPMVGAFDPLVDDITDIGARDRTVAERDRLRGEVERYETGPWAWLIRRLAARPPRRD